MSEIADLLERTKDSNKKERQKAVKELGNLDKRYNPVIEVLEDLVENDPDKGVRKDAEKALKNLEGKPMEGAIADEEGGREGTGFDDEVGDASLRPGEYDMETSLSKREEDRREGLAEGKGINVRIQENNFVTMDYFGNVKEKQQSTGVIAVANTGHSNRISGVDLELNGINNISPEEPLEDRTSVGLLTPTREGDWKKEYSFEQEFTPIKVEQVYEDESGVSPNFAGGEDKSFEARISLTNTLDETIYNVRGTKTLNEYASMSGNSSTSGTVSDTDGGVSFEIAEIAAGGTVTVSINLNAAVPEDVPSYEAGELSITYENQNKLASGLEFVSVDGVSDVKRRIRRKQRETEPGFYDCEILFENRSEFVYDLNKFSVFADSMDSQNIVLDWDGSEATQDEREIVPGEKVSFEFVYESFEGTPSFGDYVEFSVQHQVETVTQTTVVLPVESLRYMALEITKSFMLDGEPVTQFELPSYVETEVPTLVTVTGVGTFPLEAVVIKDEIPVGFKAPAAEQITVSRGEREVPDSMYTVSVESASETEGQELVITLEHLEDTDEGGLNEGDVISLNYMNIAENPVPSDDPLLTQAHTEGYIYLAPETKVMASSPEEELELLVVHRRDDLDIGKMIESVEYEGKNAYRIRLEAENYGSSTATFTIEDLIPEGYEFISGSMESQPEAELVDPKSVSEGTLRGWKFENIQPDEDVWASYVVVEDSPQADPRKLQSVYRG
ncbi:MAG: hypothetical protein ACXAD7_01905 [Candidatus Kariarchaeaceae archaeon]|jgi:hypothetical protein